MRSAPRRSTASTGCPRSTTKATSASMTLAAWREAVDVRRQIALPDHARALRPDGAAGHVPGLRDAPRRAARLRRGRSGRAAGRRRDRLHQDLQARAAGRARQGRRFRSRRATRRRSPTSSSTRRCAIPARSRSAIRAGSAGRSASRNARRRRATRHDAGQGHRVPRHRRGGQHRLGHHRRPGGGLRRHVLPARPGAGARSRQSRPRALRHR